MKVEGGCYCGGVRYVAEGDPVMRAQCHCRECQYITGGSPNVFMGMPASGFAWVKGAPKGFTRSDIQGAATREFCPDCGTHLVTRSPAMATAVILKVGGMDDPSQFGMPQIAIQTADAQAFHRIPDGVAQFERWPGR